MDPRQGAGPLLRAWRVSRRMSQLDVSTRTGVSTRHLSCVETGRAQPSRDLLLFLATELEIPKRATNDLLLAAGFAPVYSHLALDDDAMARVRAVVRLMLDGNDPNPTSVIDTRWNLIDANAAAFWLTSGVDPELLVPPINVGRLSLHPDGLAPRIANLDAYAAHLLHSMRHALAATRDPQLADLIDELDGYTPGAARTVDQTEDVVLPLQITVEGHDLSFMSTVTTFGTALDVTLSELSIETFYPADDHTASLIASRPWFATAPRSPR